MALFKFRKGRDEQPAPSKKAPTVEAVRRRAMHRLIGAAVLVLAGVIGFPLVFDNQPRPIAVDLPIEIVDKAKVKPLALPPVDPPSIAAAEPDKNAEPVDTAAPEPSSRPVVTAAAPPPESAAPVAPAATAVKPPASSAAAAPAAPDTRALDAKKARALLEARPLPADAAASAPKPVATPPKPLVAEAAKPVVGSEARFVVQVGAFADAAKVREVRRKVESAGLKTYTQVVSTSEGDRTRVRVGPFEDRAAADKAAEKIRKVNLSAAILSL